MFSITRWNCCCPNESFLLFLNIVSFSNYFQETFEVICLVKSTAGVRFKKNGRNKKWNLLSFRINVHVVYCKYVLYDYGLQIFRFSIFREKRKILGHFLRKTKKKRKKSYLLKSSKFEPFLKNFWPKISR